MIRTVLTLAFAGATGAAGYIGGSVYPAPPEIVDKINAETNELRAKLKLEKVDLAGLKNLIPHDKFNELNEQMKTLAQQSGEIIVVDNAPKSAEEAQQASDMRSIEAMPAPVPVAAPAAAPASGAASAPTATSSGKVAPAVKAATPGQLFLAALSLCPKMTIENEPAADAKGVLTKYHTFVTVKGVKLATDPAPTACLSSGYGTRDGKLHKGVDFHNQDGGPILSAGEGQILEKKYRDDYGNTILIDHGGGVYTRYAHLASFGPGLAPGVKVHVGEQIGLMGNTAGYQVPIHLHYEVLTGDYNTPKQSFGLTSSDIFSYPAAS